MAEQQSKHDFKVVLVGANSERLQERVFGDYQYVESAGHPDQEAAVAKGREMIASGTWPAARGLVVERWEQRPLQGWYCSGVVHREFPYKQ